MPSFSQSGVLSPPLAAYVDPERHRLALRLDAKAFNFAGRVTPGSVTNLIVNRTMGGGANVCDELGRGWVCVSAG